MKETNAIEALLKHARRAPVQRNRPFEADAEIVELDGRTLAFTTDEFSAEDALSFADDPEALGWNVATATLSDLLAVGAEPRFLLQSVVLAPAQDRAALELFSRGIQAALEAVGAHLLGGDVGQGDTWRYAGFAVGTFRAGERPLTRRIAADEGLLLATGAFGGANLAAFTNAPAPRFPCRLAESRRLAAHATLSAAACIDTSDGLARALETLAAQNPPLRLEVDVNAAPFAAGVKEFAAARELPPEAFLLGSAGEYELLALAPKAQGRALLEAGGFTEIGSFTRGDEAGLHYRKGDTVKSARDRATPDPRASESPDKYCQAVIDLARELFE